jgi:hypothetical protein
MLTVRKTLILCFLRLFENLKDQFEVEKGQLLQERQSLTAQLSQLKEKNNSLDSQHRELSGLLEKQKLCNE